MASSRRTRSSVLGCVENNVAIPPRNTVSAAAANPRMSKSRRPLHARRQAPIETPPDGAPWKRAPFGQKGWLGGCQLLRESNERRIPRIPRIPRVSRLAGNVPEDEAEHAVVSAQGPWGMFMVESRPVTPGVPRCCSMRPRIVMSPKSAAISAPAANVTSENALTATSCAGVTRAL